jgi:hypothetical protein
MRSSTHSLRIVAVVAIVATGLIHLATARDSFGEATYKGLLFVANGVGALVAAVGVYRDRADWGWLLGALVAGGHSWGTCSVAPSACRVCRPSPMPGSNHSGSPPW